MMIRWIRHFVSTCFRSPDLVRARRGQAIIMFALMAVPMIGMLGLVVDSGVYLYARRTAQAAADAAALAGARQLSKSTLESPRPAQDEVEKVAALNGQGGVAPTVVECRYVNDEDDPVSGGTTCGDPPDDASGVLVRTQETVPTFFINIIPGAPTSAETTASAIARVQVADGIKADAPFIVCGYGSWDVTDDPDTKNGGRNRPILLGDDPPEINPEAIGQTFRIWDSRLAQEGAGCDEGSQFKGLANSEENKNRTTPGWLEYLNGSKAGPTRSKVSGPGGCEAGMDDPDGCVLILPLATNNPPSGGSGREIYGVGYAAFRMSPVDSNSYNGTLLDAYILDAPGADGWTQGRGGAVSVRLAG